MHRVNTTPGIQTHYPGTWMIASIAMVMAIATSGSCFFGTATNLCEAYGRRCSPGQVCAANQDICINIGGCGDGIISPDKGEICDDGNITDGDGCSPDCTSDESCGNGKTDNGESCDDGNRTPGDGCNADCNAEVCGNLIVDKGLGEVCDDGNAISGDGCSASCRSNEACGNGTIDDDGSGGLLHEECEFSNAPFPGPVLDTPICDDDCTLPMCGDGHTNIMYTVTGLGPDHTEQCDSGTMGMRMDSAICDDDCTIPACGDNHTNPMFIPPGATRGEECDKGSNNSDTTPDACRKNCQKASCGDGVMDTGETCDDGDKDIHDDCPDGPSGSCKPATCGDGFIKTNSPNAEQCDNGPNNNSDTAPNACRTNCLNPFCGDGVIDSGEVCDKGSGDPGCPGQPQCNSDCSACS